MAKLLDNSIDMVLCDMPYGVTQNKWDTPLNLDDMWQQYERVIKSNGVIVLFGQGMFSSRLMLSNPTLYRYTLIWKKTTSTGFLNSKRQPLRCHEDILVFYKASPTYNPQMTNGHRPVHTYTKHTSDGTNYGKTKTGISGGGSTSRYPTSIIEFATDKQKEHFHPTQKPITLLEWLILTYTNPGEAVLDNCCGSGSTLVAANNTGREYIGIDIDHQYIKVSEKRLLPNKAAN